MVSWVSDESQKFLVPPRVATPFPGGLPSGTVRLYNDPVWSSNKNDYLEITTKGNTAKDPHSIVQTGHNDKATWVAFNLPVGTVMTLLENPITGPSKKSDPNNPDAANPFNFSGAGRFIDLVGNGSLQTVNLLECNLNDSVSAYIWRTVDVGVGVFQLFEHPQFSGVGNNFYLAEWGYGNSHSLSNWWIYKKASSLYFGGLGVCALTLYSNTDGSGYQANTAGWIDVGSEGPNGKGVNLATYNAFDDAAASWSYDPLTPIQLEVQPFTFKTTAVVDDALSQVFSNTGRNTGGSTVTQKSTFKVTTSESATVTISKTSTETFTYMEGFKVSNKAGIANIGEVTTEISGSFTQQFSKTTSNTKTTTTTQTIETNFEQDLTIGANSSWVSTLTIQYTKLPPMPYTTTANYYYDQQVPGSVLDPEKATLYGAPVLYRLPVTISGTASAILSLNSQSTINTVPIG